MRNRSSVSKARSYREMGDYWDHHDLSEVWQQGRPVAFEVDISSETVYCALDAPLAASAQKVAAKRGVSLDTLLNLWVQEKLKERTA
jgi:hypothetical protein